MFIGKYGQNILFAPLRWLVSFYVYSGLAFMFTGTERYIDSRPADFFLLFYATGFMLLKQALLLGLFLLGIFSLSAYLIMAGILVISPPFIAMAVLEFFMWLHPK